jgi:FKBP-type peptidyl-prolyl cis-trans isomerase SlyD
MLSQNRTVVSIHFTIKDELGSFLESTNDNAPFTYLQGADYLPQAIEAAIDARKTGDEFTLFLSPEEAYGYPDNTLIRQVPLSDIKANGEPIQPGNFVSLGDDRYEWVVRSIQDNVVCIDANHPWAGKTIDIRIKIVKRRPALAAEINKGIALEEDVPAFACGPNCHC